MNVLRDSREETGNALSWAIRCIGSFRLGRVHGDNKQIIASREIYGRAIPALANAINNPSLVLTDETLAAATLLGTYEILNDDGQATWVTHSGGIGALIRLRGPKAHLDGFGRTLFLSFRPWLIFAAFMQGEKSFLEEDEWRETIPEILERERKSGKTSPLANTVECAYYEVARCPGYVAETRSLISFALFSETSRKKLIARITSTQQAMEKFRMDISEGLSPNAAFTGHGDSEFAGAMPMDVAGIMGEYAVQTMVSATTLLQKLLVVLEHHRRQQQLEQSSEYKNDPWAVLNDNAPLTPESMVQSPPPDTLKQLGLDSKEEILVRVALSMGVMTETPPI